jgi:hypothetical protein
LALGDLVDQEALERHEFYNLLEVFLEGPDGIIFFQPMAVEAPLEDHLALHQVQLTHGGCDPP